MGSGQLSIHTCVNNLCDTDKFIKERTHYPLLVSTLSYFVDLKNTYFLQYFTFYILTVN